LFLKYKDKKEIVKMSIILLIIMVLLVSPYVLFLKSQTGKYQITGKGGINFLIGDKILGKNSEKNIYSLNEEKTQLASYEITQQYSFFDYILKNPLNLIERFVRSMLDEIRLLSYLLIPIMLPLFLSLFNKDLFEDNAMIAPKADTSGWYARHIKCRWLALLATPGPTTGTSQNPRFCDVPRIFGFWSIAAAQPLCLL